MKQEKIISNIFVCLVIFVFMTFSVSAAQSSVNLGTAGNFVILAKSGISTTGTTSITGNIGVSPIDSTGLTGLGLTMDSSNEFATSATVTGKAYASDYAPPTPTTMTTAISDMEIAYTDAAGRSLPDYTELGAGNIDGMTLAPGLYKWGTGVTIPTGVTLSGGPNDVWIFQIAQDLTVGNGAIVTLSGGAQAKNIFWQVAGQSTLGTTADFKGIILSQTAIAMNTGATLNGRALAQTAVTLDANAITAPSTQMPIQVPTTGDKGDNLGVDRVSGQRPMLTENITTVVGQQLSTEVKTTSAVQGDGIKSDSAVKVADSTNKNSSVEKIQTGIGQELNTQISVRKEEIKSGTYTVSNNGSLGQLLNVKELAQGLRELRVNNVSAQTDLNITANTDSAGKTKLITKLRNGQELEIKIMPNTASEKALTRLGVKVCSQENNCTIQLKTVGSGTDEKIQYSVQLERHSKILGIFQQKMHVSANVDAQTGDTQVHKPWWAFIASEPAE